MDLPPHFNLLIPTALFTVGLVLGVLLGKYHPFKKNIGEERVADEISRNFHLPHALLNNVTFVLPLGTTQIDHVLVAETGIFVIETKHYSGWIYGGEKQAQWTQVIFKKKSRFQNPIRQNYAHLKTLQELLKLPDSALFSVVVFTHNEVKFKTDLGKQVLRLPQLVPFLTTARPVLFNAEKLAQLVGFLEMNRLRRSVETDEYHIDHLRKRFGKESSPLRTVGVLPTATPQASPTQQIILTAEPNAKAQSDTTNRRRMHSPQRHKSPNTVL